MQNSSASKRRDSWLFPAVHRHLPPGSADSHSYRHQAPGLASRLARLTIRFRSSWRVILQKPAEVQICSISSRFAWSFQSTPTSLSAKRISSRRWKIGPGGCRASCPQPHGGARGRTRLRRFWGGELQELLQINPGLEAKTLFEYVQRQYPGRFQDGQLRRPVGSVLCTTRSP
jgi:hypothetical protein